MVNTDIGVYLAIGSLSHIPVKLITGYVSDTFLLVFLKKIIIKY